jgi:uncharacterized metal-binding protein
MPAARTHDAITVATGLALAPVGYVALLNLRPSTQLAALGTLILMGAHMISGIMFSPDLDLDSAIDDRWGIFFWIWRPYMWLVPHRSRWLSHGLVISALLRLFYFYLVVMLLFVAFAWAIGQLGIVVPDYHVRATGYLIGLARTHPHEVLAFVVGFVTGGAAHTIADWMVTGGRRYLRRLGFRIARDYSDHDRWRPRYRSRRARSWGGYGAERHD